MSSAKYDFDVDLSERNNSHTLMVEMVGKDKRVLEVGCATGYMSGLLGERGCRVVGIELDPVAAEKAKAHCENVVVGDVETLDLVATFGEGGFDAIVFGDILEHLNDPLTTLTRMHSILVRHGFIVASIPNIAHGAVRLALLQGRFEYQPLGLLDGTHVRFFTRDTVERLFRGAGFAVIEMERTVRAVFDTEIPLRRDDFPKRVVRYVEADPEATTYQFVVRAVPAASRSHFESQGRRVIFEGSSRHRTVVVIPNWNGISHLDECLNSLRKQTFQDFETLVVDNGSTDGSLDLLRREYPWVRVIGLSKNRGFSAAVNAGIRASDSEYIVLLNNDTRVDNDWLGNLVRAMDETSGASFGTSKMLNYYRPDRIDTAGNGFSIRLGAGINLGRGESADRYSRRQWVFGACAGSAIYRRSLFEDIGVFDEDFFLVFEDVDIDLRAQIAGHRCLYVPDSIVFHKWGGSTDLQAPEVRARSLRNAIYVAGKGLPWPLLLLWLGFFVSRKSWALMRHLIRLMFFSLQKATGPADDRGGVSRIQPRLVRNYFLPEVRGALRELRAKRNAVQKTRRVGSLKLLRTLLWAYEPLKQKVDGSIGSDHSKGLVSVVIPNWNGGEMIASALDSLRAQSYGQLEVIVVDNGSSDGSVELISSKYPEVSLIALAENKGFSGAVNEGILRARGEFVALLNNDAVAHPGWLVTSVARLRKDPSLGVATARLLLLDDRESQRLDSSGNCYSIWGIPYPRGRAEVDAGQFDPETEVFAASGAASVWRREVFDAVGLFDPEFFIYHEDVDLSFRARLAGYGVTYEPSAVVFHRVGATSGGGYTPTVRYHSVKNVWYVYLKNMPARLFWKYLPRFVAAQLLMLGGSLEKGLLWQHLAGAFRGARMTPRMWKSRRMIQRKRITPHREIEKLLSLDLPAPYRSRLKTLFL